MDLVGAVEQADMILVASENLDSDEMPPQWMWPFPNELDEWFAEVRRARKAKFGTHSNDESDDTDWEQNELTKGLR